MGLILKRYLMYDQIPPSRYCKIVAAVESERYWLQTIEGIVFEYLPYQPNKNDKHTYCYSTEGEAVKAAESKFNLLESQGWHLHT